MRKKIIFLAMVVTVCGAALFAQSESDFIVRLDDAGTGCVITGYEGSATNITIPAKIEGLPVSIGDMAFHSLSCPALISVKISEGITVIGSEAFYEQETLKTVTLPRTLTKIEDGAFYNTGITTITLPDSLQSIGSEAFSRSKLTKISIPDSVTDIGREAFAYTPLTEIKLSRNITKINGAVFACCENLKSITIPANIKFIESIAFGYCSELREIVFPEGVEDIRLSNSAFDGCEKLTLATQTKLRKFPTVGIEGGK